MCVIASGSTALLLNDGWPPRLRSGFLNPLALWVELRGCGIEGV